MKKFVILFVVGIIGLNVQSFSQAVDDRAVIPVAVTLNSILRLNVKSGGNIDFNFNTLDQYNSGITNSSAYDTKITVASSVNFNVNMYAEDASLLGTDSIGGSNSMPLAFIGYEVTATGTGSANSTVPGGVQALSSTATTAIVTASGSNAGDVEANAFTISWECGTGNGASSGPILGNNFAADRYATNVFFVLEPAP